MRAPRLPESISRVLSTLGSAYFHDSGRDAAAAREVRYVVDYYRIRAEDHVTAATDPSKNLGAGTVIDSISDYWRAERSGRATVADCDTVTYQAVITEDRVAVDDVTAM